MRFLSIIVPTLNEAETLEKVLRHTEKQAILNIEKEIIVVDSGSSDGTQKIASGLGAQVVQLQGEPRGRAFALNEGAKLAKGDVLLFLDADTFLPQAYDAEIAYVLKNTDVVGGAFEFTLDGEESGLRVVEGINRLRYRIWPRYYGDQGIFARKETFEKVGGYPEIPIMEASHFCVSLKKKGKIRLIPKEARTSARRFLEGGIYQVLWKDIQIWWLDLLGFSTEHFAKAYWQNNKDQTYSNQHKTRQN